LFHLKSRIWLRFETSICRDDNKKHCKNGAERAKKNEFYNAILSLEGESMDWRQNIIISKMRMDAIWHPFFAEEIRPMALPITCFYEKITAEKKSFELQAIIWQNAFKIYRLFSRLCF